ncbi:phosphatidate cytidylyltransferase [Bacillus thuringiensis serovar shandongiensis]|nr:phosphatidate cytidylyltransferase [Bacillus thuringiensis serovar malayensis]OUB07931.1 phosphatidate cytidylyltransferase [Bacillus thuringiensis serovar shandongiensis]
MYALASIELYELIRMNKLTLILIPTVLAALLLLITLILSTASELFTDFAIRESPYRTLGMG